MHSAIGEGAGVEDKEVLGAKFWEVGDCLVGGFGGWWIGWLVCWLLVWWLVVWWVWWCVDWLDGWVVA